ncbi:unnamed protein product [Mytilus edulis]|uniref:C-terminal of Roc (COR) domain-containing protein n=1 Tax=Mytilus edulis TaxID=6550 RepID=A0A8S3T1R1_MYTED|nr:unnamed protein product [Mytilus edulis]
MDECPSPVKCGPPPLKRGRMSINWQRCIICQNITQETLSMTTDRGFTTLMNAVRQRQDGVFRLFLSEVDTLDDIIMNNIKYHKTCYRTYTSKHNIPSPSSCISAAKVQQQQSQAETTSSCASPNILTRSRLSLDFLCCIFCKNKTFKKDRKLHRVSSSMRVQSLFETATKHADNEMLFQIADKDFTSNALYHSGCITKYLLREKEIKAETDENNTGTMYDKAFTSFVESISEELFVHKMVFSLSYLLSKYKSFLPEDVSSKYTSYRLQLRLKNHFREHIVVDVNHGQGESNFVYSSSLTLREAVRTAIRFKAETKFTKLQMSACTSKNDQTDENQILYSAASILRREIKNAVVPMDTYPSVDEMSLSKSLETVPSVLTGFINWLIDDSHSQVCEEINGETEHLEYQKSRLRSHKNPANRRESIFLTTCAPFTKPKQRAEPSRKNDVYSKLSACVLPYAETSDLIWVLLRNLSRTIVDLPYKQPSFEGQQIPFWTGFNKQISNISTTYHVVSYPPIIDAKPSDMGTVYTTMKRCADMCQKAGQPFSIQTFDLQLYAVAQQVKWDRPSEFKSHILRLGGFHTLSCFISSIGKIWGDGGLRDLLVDSGVYAAATVDQMLSGKQFNRAVRGLTLLYETLKTLWICSFFVWIRQQKCLEIPESLFVGLTECHESFTSNGRTFDMLQSLEKALNDDLGSKMNEFREWGGQGENNCLVLAGAFSNPEIVRQLSNEHVIDLPDLFCSHEEADTRILLHVIHSDKIFQQLSIRGRIIVKCSDTDVLVLCVHYFKVLVSTEQMWFLTGSTNSLRDCRRYIPIHELSKSLSPLLANILPAVHALTGCDTTSAIFGFGKKTVFKLIRKSPSKFTNLQNFDKIDFSTLLSAARELISSLYDPKDKFASSHVDLNKLRVKLATCKDTNYVGFWFDSIHCYRTVDRRTDEESMNPPVIVVLTGKDRIGKNKLQGRQKYLDDQFSQLHGEQEKYQHYRHKYFISNTKDPDKIFEKIRKKISEIAQNMPLWGKSVPLKWILLENLINVNRDNGKHFISFNDMIKMAKQPEIGILDKGEVSTFLHFQHEVGNIIFFKDIPDLIILEPQWLANAFRCLVSDRFKIDDVHDVSPIDKRQISSDWTLK